MVSVDVALVGAETPKKVQIAVTGLTAGDHYQITGSGAGSQWSVRAGVGAASGSQVVITDVAAPINVPVTYTAVTDSGDATSAAITVPWSDAFGSKYLLQSLDASVAVPFVWIDNGLPREPGMRVNAYAVPGRGSPVAVYDFPTFESGELVVTTRGAGTASMRDLLALGGIVMLRTDGTVRDLEPVSFLAITRAPSQLTGAGIGTTEDRQWVLSYDVLEDPEPNTAVAFATWADFDAAYSTLTWADFDSEWSTLTWNDFDRTDWTAH